MSKARNNLPKYLNKYITKQDYSLYTAIDQAVWRYIMYISVPFYKKYAHPVYLEGLQKTGIPLDQIPNIDSMDQKLDKFCWGAVAVKGFIPPTAFMDMLANKVLAIGVDIRTSEHLMYTPSPDIIHETAGHAPIIADKDYANYLCSYGEISKKAIYSKDDEAIYEIIRKLSDLKEDPNAKAEEIEKYEKLLAECNKQTGYISEAAELARMNWWTAEYGLIGTLENPKIYGAGLLSSVIESFGSINSKVKKIKYDLDCINYNYDITKQQPQLFVTDNFNKLTTYLNEYSKTMAFKTGGLEGLKKAQGSNSVTTTHLDSDLSISGILYDYKKYNDKLSYLRFSGPTQLCYKEIEIKGHSKSYHMDGFGCPIGTLKGINKSIHHCNKQELESLGISIGINKTIIYNNKIIISGNINDISFINNQPQIIKFENCTVKQDDNIFFKPEWGDYDLISGMEIKSVYGGPADYKKYYIDNDDSLNYSQSSTLTESNQELNNLFEKISNIKSNSKNISKLPKILDKIFKNHPNEWLILFEIFNVIIDNDRCKNMKEVIIRKLDSLSKKDKKHTQIIQRGINLLSSSIPS